MAAARGRLYELLRQHGVGERGAHLYLAACGGGPQTASELARVTGMHRVEAYRLIRQLEVSGLLRVTGRRPMRFGPLPPEDLMDRWIRAATERLRRLETDRDRTLEDIRSGILDLTPEDPTKFAVLEGQNEIYRYLVRRIGTAKNAIRAALPGAALPLAINGGVDRALRTAHERGVKVQVVTDIHPAYATEAKLFAGFVDLRHSPRALVNRAMVIDRLGAVAYVSGPEGIGGTSESQVAVWSGSPSFRALTEDYIRRAWAHSIPASRRFVELETTGDVELPVRRGAERDPFLRLEEIATLGMRTMGIEELRVSLPEMIETLGGQVGRQMGEGLDGETPSEVARSMVEYYQRHAMGRLEVVREQPLTLKVTRCFACVPQSTEIGRRLCPMMLKAALERRIGGEIDVTRPDPTRHASRGCVFTVTSS